MSGTRVWYTSAPFLKWPGGKRWLAIHANELAPLCFKHYFEPFLGSGAIFFGLRPLKATLSDTNAELINCYRQIQTDWLNVWNGLQEYATMHSFEFYYRTREQDFSEDLTGAVRFLYLNRACFNGIYRVNRDGKFNVPKGSKTLIVFPYDNFEFVNNAISNTQLECSDFEKLIDSAHLGDFVFCDPPYTVAHSSNGFIKYNDKLFSWADQLRLRDALRRANERGAFALLSNADFPGVRDLYDDVDGFRCMPISRASVISGKPSARGTYDELLISNYPLRIPRSN
jgi:DNA adenine methylase